jgi:hypothetical protein
MVHPQLKDNELPISGALVGLESHNSSIYPSCTVGQLVGACSLFCPLNRMTPELSRETSIHMMQQQCSNKPKAMDGALVAAGSQNSIHLSIHSFIHPSIHVHWLG